MKIPHIENPKPRENGADEVWHLSIGRNQWKIESKKEKICGSTSYVCIRRGAIPAGEREIDQGEFRIGGFIYFDENNKATTPRFDNRTCGALP